MADEGRIRVELAWLSGEDSAAAQQMAKDLKSIAESMSVFNTQDYKESIKQMASLADSLRETSDWIRDFKQDSRNRQNLPHERARQAASPDQAQTVDPGDVKRVAEANAEAARKEDKERQDRERELTDDLRQARQTYAVGQPLQPERPISSYLEPAGAPRLTSPQNMGPTASGVGFTAAAARRGIDLTPTAMAADAGGGGGGGDAPPPPDDGGGGGPGDPDDSGGGVRGWLAGQLPTGERMRKYLGNQFSVGYLTNEMQRYLQGRDESTPNVAMGYSREGTFAQLPFSTFGVQTPFSPYGAEQFRQIRDSFRLRFQAGINGRQAGAINQAIAGEGFAGDTAHDLRFNLLAPLMRRYNVNPEELAPFFQGLRTGTASIEDLNRVLGDMGEVARGANLNLTQYTAGLKAAADQAQQTGGSYVRGMDFGRQFTESTGLGPDVGVRLGENPIVQGFISARSGLPAGAQGALDPVTRMRGTYDALKSMVTAYSGSVQGHSEVVKDYKGREFTLKTTAKDVAIGMAANRLGIDFDEAKKMIDSGGQQTEDAAVAYAAVQQYERGTENAATTMAPKTSRQRRSWIERQIAASPGSSTNPMGTARYRYVHTTNHRWEDGQFVGDDSRGKPMVIADRKSVGGYSQQWAEKYGSTDLKTLKDIAIHAGVDPTDFAEATKKGTRGERGEAVRRLIDEKTREQNAQYQIAFTGDAARYFKLLAKGEHPAPPGPRNAPAGTSQGPDPTGRPTPP